MPLRYFGHSAFELTTSTGKVVLIDPWLSGNPTCPADCKHPQKADLIILSHGHGDHASDAAAIAKATGAKVCAVWELCSLLVKEGLPETQVCRTNKGGTITELGLQITMTQAFHSSSYQMQDGSVQYAGEPCGILLKLESGRVIYHAGDTALFTDMKLIAEFNKIDIAIIPIGDRLTMGPREAALAVSWLKPRLVIPMHYGTFPGIEGNPEEFKRLVGDTAEVRILKPGEVYKA